MPEEIKFCTLATKYQTFFSVISKYSINLRKNREKMTSRLKIYNSSHSIVLQLDKSALALLENIASWLRWGQKNFYNRIWYTYILIYTRHLKMHMEAKLHLSVGKAVNWPSDFNFPRGAIALLCYYYIIRFNDSMHQFTRFSCYRSLASWTGTADLRLYIKLNVKITRFSRSAASSRL